MAKLSEARKRANKKWDAQHKDKMRLYSYRAYAKKFVRDLATAEDLDDISKLIEQRRAQLKDS